MNNHVELSSVDGQLVADFLKANPDYFTSSEGQQLLKDIDVRDPHKGDNISMLEYQVQILRADKQKYARDLSTLASIAENNKATLDELQKILTKVIACDSLLDLITTCEQYWRDGFGISLVRTISFDRSYPGLRNRCVALKDAPTAVHEAMTMDSIASFPGSEELSEYLGDDDAEVQSWCILPLTVTRSEFLQLRLAICFGSNRSDGFSDTNTGTDFLQFMRSVLESLMLKAVSKIPL